MGLASFLGSTHFRSRKYLPAAFGACPENHTCKHEVIPHNNRASSQIDKLTKSLYNSSDFTVCPAGDTPERKSISDAMAFCSIPIVDDSCQMPFDAYLPKFYIRSQTSRWEKCPSCFAEDLLNVTESEEFASLQRGLELARTAYTYKDIEGSVID